MLRRVGFRYAWRVDPFDGGPHFTAATDEVTLVRGSHASRIAGWLPPGASVKTRALVAVERPLPPFIEATVTPWRQESDGALVSEDAVECLGLREGEEVVY